jgi:hypothetical protein
VPSFQQVGRHAGAHSTESDKAHIDVAVR